MRNFLILSVLVTIATLSVQAADLVVCDHTALSGVYEGQFRSMDSYTGEIISTSTRVEIGQDIQRSKNIFNIMTARTNIRCASNKVVSATYIVRCYEDGSARLVLIDEGNAQCSLGNDPELILHSDRLQIRTGLETPIIKND